MTKLLEAAKKAQECVDYDLAIVYTKRHEDVSVMLRTAIAKAKGETP